MNANQMKDATHERVEIILRTNASLTLSERTKCEAKIREILSTEEIEICDLSFQEGSTIITIGLLVGSGLAFCLVHLFGGALKKFGERGAEALLAKWRTTDAHGNQLPSATKKDDMPVIALPIKSTPLELPEGVYGTDLPKEAVELIRSVNALVVFTDNLPGNEKSYTVIAITYNSETQERVEEIYQRKTSKR